MRSYFHPSSLSIHTRLSLAAFSATRWKVVSPKSTSVARVRQVHFAPYICKYTPFSFVFNVSSLRCPFQLSNSRKPQHRSDHAHKHPAQSSHDFFVIRLKISKAFVGYPATFYTCFSQKSLLPRYLISLFASAKFIPLPHGFRLQPFLTDQTHDISIRLFTTSYLSLRLYFALYRRCPN